MKKFGVTTWFFLCSFLFLFWIGFNSCAKDKSQKPPDKPDQTPTDELRDPYWQNGKVGGNNTQRKQQLAKKYNNLLVFHADDTMQVNKTYIATLALARNMALGPLKMKVLEVSDATDDNVIVDTIIQLGKRMRANLKDLGPLDSKSFRIELLGSDEQNLNNTTESYWQWNIEPLKAGHHKLKISIQVLLGDEGEVNLPTKDIPVTIFAQKVSFSAKLENFFSKYWQWIVTGILLPIFIAWLTNRIKRGNEPKKV